MQEKLLGIVKDMVFGTAFLSLCLFVSVQVSSLNLISPYDAKSLSGETADGAAVALPDMTWNSLNVFPCAEWYVEAWVQIKPSTASNARFVQIKGFSGDTPVDCYMTWTPTGPPTFTFGGTDVSVSGYTNSRQENVWFYLLMTFGVGDIRGHLGFRDATTNQFIARLSETIALKRESSFMAPANSNPFYVSSK